MSLQQRPWLRLIASTLAGALMHGQPAVAKPPKAANAGNWQSPGGDTRYRKVVRDSAAMVSDAEAQRLAAARGLSITNVTWEDTGRFKGSSVGPNISDMTIQVATAAGRGGQMEITTMPVIRFPNFSDKTADLSPDDFTLLVGNHAGDDLRRVSLTEFLAEPTRFLSRPDSWKGRSRTLLAERDTKVLVSAQACFLPVPRQGKATFNPVLFNYQSVKGDPAVLTILATREGTSVTVIDNARDGFRTGFAWGQRLFHNADGKRASLTGERESDYVAKGGADTGPQTGSPVARHDASGMNMVLLIQVPLKQRHPMQMQFGAAGAPAEMMADSAPMKSERRRSDVENAVIGHGDVEGPFTEIDGLEIERDDRFPVRVTVQFYKATSNGVVSVADLDEIKRQIDAVYSGAESVGSLVTQGETGRVTEYDGAKVQPWNWWSAFWERYEQDTGVPRGVARARLSELLGRSYFNQPVTALYLRDRLRERPVLEKK